MAEEPLNGGPGAKVSVFDYSVENHFRAMDTISKLCEEPKIDGLDETDIRRFSSSITFLREWRHFDYEPRIIRFANELKDSPGKDVSLGIELPQFSSATVPKQQDRVYGSNASVEYGKDFVMYVGGSVWALDWRPQVHENPNSLVKCEFIAIAAHPPESYYHKLGAPLIGRGIIQIWCVINAGVNEEEATLPKEKSKQIPQNTEAVNESSAKRTRGRPRKMPIDESQTDQVKRSKGRYRKKSIVEFPDSDPDVQPLAVQYPGISFQPVSTDNVPGNTQENVPHKNNKKQKVRKEATCTSDATPQTSKKSIKLKSKTQEKNNGDSKIENEKSESSAMNQQIHFNTGQEATVSNNVLGCNSIKVSPGSLSIPGDIALPRAVLCLAHNGKVAWDVKWQPYHKHDSKCNQRMGYLAVLLGNGSLEVWEVPLLNMIKTIYSTSPKQGTDPRFVKLDPVFKCSKLKCGDIQSIPLTVEWSTSPPHDYLLAGCHDGMVALWKFSASGSPKINDTRPLLCFSADTAPIRSVAWAPSGSDMESSNVILTAGHGGVKFWDIRDPFLPLWDVHPAPKFIYSLDWLPEPRCVIISFDDGTMKLLSLVQAACDVPVTGKPFGGSKQQGLHVYNCSSFAIWCVQVSRLTGMVAYCGADGTATYFQLTSKAVDKDFSRNRSPHFACGSLTEEEPAVIVNTPLPDKPLPLKKPSSECGDGQRSMRYFLTESLGKNAKHRKAKVPTSNQRTLALYDGNDPSVESEPDETLAALKSKMKPKSKSERTLALCYGNDPSLESEPEETLAALKSKMKPNSKSDGKKKDNDRQALAQGTKEATNKEREETEKEGESQMETFPPKIVAMHRVRWNMNKGSERWLCYGGAAGIVRCQEITVRDVHKKLTRKR
ncbi:uncharacterized protein [Gossypium hirsutum]|uniref:Uncharacterized protein isoform X1 n=1 Tax=Gossypium hirsutum TaxID=3635 RepID=A0ABM3BZZ0_GOSHI|nr:uncharacterized protein LOC107944108 isoform X1 [Gossypium hirsutum]XP_040972628.1 uncharacterized protein LOC107944108 isoform X1 [Gossypium hirsutum]